MECHKSNYEDEFAGLPAAHEGVAAAGHTRNFVGALPPSDLPGTQLLKKDLLPPPSIMTISLEGYAGQGEDLIGVVIFHDFGIHAVHISIRDEHGNLIENGEVTPCPDDPICWEYYPTALVTAGTPVIVEVVAEDCMGSLAVWQEGKTLGEVGAG
jgi:hypothetical protein